MKKLFLLFGLLPLIFSAQIKTMDVPFEEFEYNAASCNGFRSGSGSLIYIPENAFVPEEGICKGKIIVKYRELHTKADMLVSGVNMILNRKGKRKILESIGMFEIRAFCNGKPMKLADGKYIQVRMRCYRDFQNIESFVYDKEKRYWLDAGIPVYDFSYNSDNNNANNANLWGSSAVGASNVERIDSLGNEGGYMTVTNIFGKLPEGYFKGMNIKTMGWYNYDRVIKDEKAVPFTPVFTVNTGDSVTFPVYVAYEKTNSLIQYYEWDLQENFVLIPQKGIRIFALLKDGSVAIVKQEFLDKLNIENLKKKTFTIPLEKQPGKPKDKPALAEATKINQ